MISIAQSQLADLTAKSLIRRIRELLFETGSVDPSQNRDALDSVVGMVLHEASLLGIATERLLGMYALIRISDGVDPKQHLGYSSVIQAVAMSEADRAHLMQMIRLGELRVPARSSY
jgi:hypothetical protein